MLPGICHLLAAGCGLITPGELGAVETAAGGKFPLRFGRQVLARTFRVSQGVAVGDVNDRMIIEPTERTARSVGPPPVGAKLEYPPLAPVAQIIDRMLGRIFATSTLPRSNTACWRMRSISSYEGRGLV